MNHPSLFKLSEASVLQDKGLQNCEVVLTHHLTQQRTVSGRVKELLDPRL